jgi:hypothetical protein
MVDAEYFDRLDKASEAKVEKPLDTDKLSLSLAPTLEQIKQSLEKGDIEGAKALAGCESITLSEDKEAVEDGKDKVEDKKTEEEVKESESEVKVKEEKAEEVKQSAYDFADAIESEIKLSDRDVEAKRELLKQVLQLKEKLI